MVMSTKLGRRHVIITANNDDNYHLKTIMYTFLRENNERYRQLSFRFIKCIVC